MHVRDALPRLLLEHDEVEGDLVDGDDVLARKVLAGASQEGLGKEEAADPVHCGLAVVNPVLQQLPQPRNTSHT